MKRSNLENKIFIIILVLFSSVVMFKLIKNSNEYNIVDNRLSYRFMRPSIDTILSGEYQESVEDAAADQMPKYNYFKLAYVKLSNYINIQTTYLFKLNKLNRYIKLGTINLYKDYLLYNKTPQEELEESAQDDILFINNIEKYTNANIYLYFIETDSNYDFTNNSKTDITNYLNNHLKIEKSNIDTFNITTFDNYKKYFYRTDHHWNYRGANQGYIEIANLIGLNNILKQEDKICFDEAESDGSKSKTIGSINMFQDRMCKYVYDFPEFEIYTSGEKIANYGSTDEELKESSKISYGDMYGWDEPEIIFINKESQNNKKLLIYSNSFSNAINELLASHYQETYVIDGRYYRNKTMIEYINENNIDDVLILANNILFTDDKNW